MFSNFFFRENHIVNEIMWKNMVEPEVAFLYQQASTCFRQGLCLLLGISRVLPLCHAFFKKTCTLHQGFVPENVRLVIRD
jgi:hypothetical protein